MNSENHLLFDLAISVPVVLFVWIHYRRGVLHQSHRYSTFWPRFWTGHIDFLVLWPVTYASTIAPTIGIPTSLAALLVVVDTLVFYLYTILMHGRYGQTVGKMATKVQVLDSWTEQKISFWQAFLRDGVPLILSLGLLVYLIWLLGPESLVDPSANPKGEALAARKHVLILIALPLLWFGAEVLTMLSNKKRRALHDYIAGTVVVRTNTEEDFAQKDIPRRINYRRIRTPY